MTRGRSVALTRTASINIYKLYLVLCSSPVFTYASYYGFYYRFIHGRRQTNNFLTPIQLLLAVQLDPRNLGSLNACLPLEVYVFVPVLPFKM